MKKIIKNPRKGVSLVELVIALTIIMIVSIASISLIHSAIKIEVRATAIIEANKTAESIIETYRYSNFFETDNEKKLKFENILDKFGELSVENKEGYILYTIDRGAYRIDIKYYTNEIEINAIYSDGTDIYKEPIKYIKG